MKYVGTIYKEVIVAKGINYTDVIAADEIELSETQYKTIPIPCKLVDGVFVKCDFPELDEFVETPPDHTGLTEVITYVGTGKSGVDNPCNITCSFAPKIVQMMGFIKADGKQESIHYATVAKSIREVIFCDKLNTEYTDAGFDYGSSSYAKKSADGKTIWWYASGGSTDQFNDVGYTYYVLAIG